MRRLILFRHSEAVHSPKFRDMERPLTEAGRNDAARVAGLLAALQLPIDLVVASPSRRTKETWEIVAPLFSPAPDLRLDEHIYECGRRDLMELARHLPDSVKTVVLVGHNPAFTEFAAHFTRNGERDAVRRLSKGFPTSGVAIFDINEPEWRKLRWGDGALTHFFV
jgi:phosphohistidine phosphatase